ncbi:MAG: LysM peptidoglycan-binding domain-containing protein, partial [Zetaproteobacteria bacterium]
MARERYQRARLRAMRWIYALAMAAAVAGCARVAPVADAPARPNAENSAAEPAEAKAREVQPPQPEAPSDTVLGEGLTSADLAAAEVHALSVYGDRWPRIAERSRYVRAAMREVFAKLQAPEDLFAVPVVESAYEPYALSPSGALGLWQLMPGTARVLGLRKTRGFDPRRAVVPSTDAALRYLLALKARFGFWPLALAAYHMGPGALARSLRRHPWTPADGLDALPAPEITREYVRLIVGLAQAMHEGALVFPEPIPMRSVWLRPPVDLVQWTEAAGVDPLVLFRTNPGLEWTRYWDRPLALRVPADAYAQLQAALDQARPRMAFVRVERGDTLWRIARRAGVPVRLLRKLNPGVDPVHLRPGMRIRAPRFAR